MQDWAQGGNAALGCSSQDRGEGKGDGVGRHRGTQHTTGASTPPNDSGPSAYADPILWQDGCKVPACFMQRTAGWQEGTFAEGTLLGVLTPQQTPENPH